MRAVVGRVVVAALVAATGCTGVAGEEIEAEDDAAESSEGDATTGEASLSSCAVEAVVAGLPNARAWSDVDDDGMAVLRVRVQSEPIDCYQRDVVVSDGARIDLAIPAAIAVPSRRELTDVDAIALLSPGGPGNDGDDFAITRLSGTVEVVTLDDEHITGNLYDAYGPLDGCFDAPICPE